MQKHVMNIGLMVILATSIFRLLPANSESKAWQFEQDQQIDSVDITMLEGGLLVPVEQPEKLNIIPPVRTKTRATVLVAATSQTSTTLKKSSKTATSAPKDPAMTDTARMVLVLDASGSMWGRIGGKARTIQAIMSPLLGPTNAQAARYLIHTPEGGIL